MFGLDDDDDDDESESGDVSVGQHEHLALDAAPSEITAAQIRCPCPSLEFPPGSLTLLMTPPQLSNGYM